MAIVRSFLVFFLIAIVGNNGYSVERKFLPEDVVCDGVAPYKDRQILVRRKNSVSKGKLSAIHKAIGAQLVQQFSTPAGLELIKIPENMTIEKAIKIYQTDSGVEYAEPDYYYQANDAPNDPEFIRQWALNNVSQSGGLDDSDINALEAWEVSKGNNEYVLGVIDTGVLYTHPDLRDNVWVNPGEIPDNKIDDDNNGYVDDVHGINAIKKNGDPLDDNGHGTHVAGIIGASGNNGVGVCGVNQSTSIVACKFLDTFGGGTASDALTCLAYFAALKDRENNPVRLVATNNSWAGGGYSQALHDAIRAHEQKGILFIAAASNEGRDNDRVDTFPADYELSNIISVAATDNKDDLAYFSNYGNQTVHVAAPGVSILSTYLGNRYSELSGTSMAAPQVTGLVGLIKAAKPELDWLSIRNLVITSGEEIPSAEGKIISGRRIRAIDSEGVGALSCDDQIVLKRLSPIGNSVTMTVGNSVTISILHLNCEAPAGVPSGSSAQGPLALNDDGEHGDRLAGDGVYSAEFAPDRAGVYHFDFGHGESLAVNVFNPDSWHTYRPVIESKFLYRTINGTKLVLSDDTSQSFSSPFPIPFAGDEAGFSTLYVGSNGLISVTNSDLSPWQNSRLPYERFQTLVAPYWDDLNPGRSGGIYYEVVGSAPNRELVIEWRNVLHFDGGNGATFQAVFFEGSSDILFNYLDVDFGNAYGFGKSATIGTQISSDQVSQFAFNEAKLSNNMAIRFTIFGAK